MELLSILRLLRRRWALAGLGVLVAVGATVFASRMEPPSGGVARTAVVLDSRPSQLLRPDPPGADTLGWRASALANLASSTETAESISRRLGVPKHDMLVTNTVLLEPEASTALARRAAKSAAIAYEPNQVLLTPREDLGMVQIVASAATKEQAARTAQATADALVARTPELGVKGVERYAIESVAPVRARIVTDDKGPVLALAAGGVALLAWLGVVALVDAGLRARGRRGRASLPGRA